MHDISQMSVKDVYFLVKRLGSDCDDYQQYRELTHNGIEAILRARAKGLLQPGEGAVVWDVDWVALQAKGVYRLTVSDDGDGMSADDLRRYINTLSSSGGTQSLDANYGVGAKIAAATRNPAGLAYRSYQNGEGVFAQLIVDDAERQVGFVRWQVDDEWHDIITGFDDAETRQEPIEDHGVSVTLLGEGEGDHTFLGPKRLDTEYKTWWLFRSLNRRYFRLPVPVKVRVFETWNVAKWPKTPADAKDASLMRTVFGQEHYLDRYSLAKGTVALSNAKARWYIMDPERGVDQRQFFETSGHVAALYQDELYELRGGNAGRKVLQNFGAVFSAKRLVVYVEPNADLGRGITTNTARTELVVDGGPLPWLDWADEFRERLPKEIRDLEHQISESSGASSHSDSIRDRLKKIRALYKVTRYKPAANGQVEAEGEVPGASPRQEGSHTGGGEGGGKSGGAGGRAGNEYFSRRMSGGSKASTLTTNSPEPETKWVSVAAGTRVTGDMEDRAARYLPGEHLLLINADFRVFGDLVTHFCKSYGGVAGARRVVTDAVQEWCEQQLVEAVMGVRAVEGSKLWSQEHIDTALSEEALTVAVMPRYHTWASVRRTLGTKLGAIQESAEL